MPTIDQHFTGRRPQVREIYDKIVAAARQLGPFTEDAKKTSIHLTRRSAFAGVATRKDGLVLTLKSSADIGSPRVVKREQASANRWHLEVKLDHPKQVDAELKEWLKKAFELSGK